MKFGPNINFIRSRMSFQINCVIYIPVHRWGDQPLAYTVFIYQQFSISNVMPIFFHSVKRNQQLTSEPISAQVKLLQILELAQLLRNRTCGTKHVVRTQCYDYFKTQIAQGRNRQKMLLLPNAIGGQLQARGGQMEIKVDYSRFHQNPLEETNIPF